MGSIDRSHVASVLLFTNRDATWDRSIDPIPPLARMRAVKKNIDGIDTLSVLIYIIHLIVQ